MQHREPLGMDDPGPKDQRGKGYYALELTGKDQSLWQRWRSRFVTRLKNKMRGFFGRRGPRGKTVESEAEEAMDSAVNSLQALLSKAAIENEKSKVEIEKLRAEIELTRAESRFTDARARESEAQSELIRAQARKLELEIQVQQVQTSITVIEAMIAKGQLTIREDVGGLYILALGPPKAHDNCLSDDQAEENKSGEASDPTRDI
jgi:hypothetical protein